MKKIFNGNSLCKVNFDPFLKIISDHIEDSFLVFERIEKIFEVLQITKKTDNEDFEKNKKNSTFDENLEKSEEFLLKNYLKIAEMRKKYQFSLLRVKELLIKNSFSCLNNESNDIDFARSASDLPLSSTNEAYCQLMINTLCNDFGINLATILKSETSLNSYEFSPIFESHFIGHLNQLKLWDESIFLEFNHKSVWPAVCLLNQKEVCVKIYRDYYPGVIEQWRTRVELVKNLSEKGKIHLQYFGSFVDDKDYYLVIELCINNLRNLIDHELEFSNSDLAYFVHSLIKDLNEIRIDENTYHVDIRPSSIFITYDHEFRIRDYKTSERFSKPRLDYGPHGFIYEKKSEYRGPEICELLLKGDEILNKWEFSDVYSLGLIILEIYSRKFIAEYRKTNDLFNYILKEQLAKVKIPWLSRLLRWMLAQNLDYRPRFENLLLMIEDDQEFMKDKEDYQQTWTKKKKFNEMMHWFELP